MGLERRIKSKSCPRECGGTILSGEQTKFNAVSTVDGKQICANCYINETISTFLGGNPDN